MGNARPRRMGMAPERAAQRAASLRPRPRALRGARHALAPRPRPARRGPPHAPEARRVLLGDHRQPRRGVGARQRPRHDDLRTVVCHRHRRVVLLVDLLRRRQLLLHRLRRRGVRQAQRGRAAGVSGGAGRLCSRACRRRTAPGARRARPRGAARPVFAPAPFPACSSQRAAVRPAARRRPHLAELRRQPHGVAGGVQLLGIGCVRELRAGAGDELPGRPGRGGHHPRALGPGRADCARRANHAPQLHRTGTGQASEGAGSGQAGARRGTGRWRRAGAAAAAERESGSSGERYGARMKRGRAVRCIVAHRRAGGVMRTESARAHAGRGRGVRGVAGGGGRGAPAMAVRGTVGANGAAALLRPGPTAARSKARAGAVAGVGQAMGGRWGGGRVGEAPWHKSGACSRCGPHTPLHHTHHPSAAVRTSPPAQRSAAARAPAAVRPPGSGARHVRGGALSAQVPRRARGDARHRGARAVPRGRGLGADQGRPASAQHWRPGDAEVRKGPHGREAAGPRATARPLTVARRATRVPLPLPPPSPGPADPAHHLRLCPQAPRARVLQAPAHVRGGTRAP
jgi:hypothetical protein